MSRKRILSCIKNFSVLFVSLCLCCSFCQPVSASSKKILFLHHSTGENVYNDGGVPDWITSYNSDHGTSYDISERNYPADPYDWANYPYDYWNLWINNACDSDNTNIECMNTLIQSYDVIIFKHCFPGAAVESDTGSPDIASQTKSLENYKLQYRALRDMMDGYPDNLFIVWTLAPLHRLETTPDDAARAKQFVDWVNEEFLTEEGKIHSNIAIFDFWKIVAEDDPNASLGKVNCLKYEYEGSHFGSDSHPNYDANQAAGPVFAQTIITAIESYFGTSNGGEAGDNGTDTGDPEEEENDDDYSDGECAATQLLDSSDSTLNTLRLFRDNVLAKNSIGKQLIKSYYNNGNKIVLILEKHPLLKKSAISLLKSTASIISNSLQHSTH